MSSSLFGRSLIKHATFGVLASLAVLALVQVAGCNTTEGLGKDIKSAGKGIEETAQDAKD